MKPITREEQYLYKLTGEETIIPEKPITREEQYLSRLCGKDNVIPQAPITRIEQYLAHLCGEEVAIPEKPITRLEQYMAFAAGEAETKPTPITRQEMLWDKYNGGFVPEEKTVDWTPVISVSDALAKPVVDYSIKITAVQTGTGDPSPTNIRSIDGWTGANISVGDSRNLFQTTASSTEIAGVTYTVNADGTISVSGTASGFSSFNMGEADISNVGAKKITISGIATATNMQWSNIRLYDINNLLVYETLSSTSPSVTIDLANYPTAVKVVPIVKRQNNVATSGVIKPMVEIGDTAHDFVQYETPTVYPVSWQTEAGTVYGGVLDVTTGTLTVTHTAETYDGTEEGWTELSQSRGYYYRFSEAMDNYSRAELLKCSCLIGTYAGSSASMPLNSIMLNQNKTNLLCRVDTETNFPSVDDWKDFLTQNPMTVLFPLAEPITYNLTPTEITLAEGANTIWSYTGDSKLTYLARAAENVRKMNATLAMNNAILKSGGKVTIEKPVLEPIDTKPILKK